MQRSALLALAVLTPLTGSCVVAVAGAAAAIGYIQYEKNEAFANFDEDYDDAWDEVVDAMKDLGYDVPKDAKPGPTEGTIEVDDVRVRVEKRSNDTVTVRVRVGTFDTEDNRRRISVLMEEIKDRLE